MADMLVKLYELEDCPELYATLKVEGIHIARCLSPDKHKVINYIKENFSEGWGSECEAAFAHPTPTIFIAVKDKKVIGFAAYEATAKNFFGPTGVSAEFRKKGIGRALMLKCLLSMREEGYGYAIIGWIAKSAQHFYETYAGATIIEDSHPGVYSRLINVVGEVENKKISPKAVQTETK